MAGVANQPVKTNVVDPLRGGDGQAALKNRKQIKAQA
jgi:hypothetical protein